MTTDLAQRLAGERTIGIQLATLARILDTRAWDRVSEVVASEIRFDYGNDGREEQGLDAVLQNFRRYLDVCGPSQHMLGSIIVEVDGDVATSRAYVQARHQGREDKASALSDSNGEYIDRWERRPEGWRYRHPEDRPRLPSVPSPGCSAVALPMPDAEPVITTVRFMFWLSMMRSNFIYM